MEVLAMMTVAPRISPVEIGMIACWMERLHGESSQESHHLPAMKTSSELGRNMAMVAMRAPRIAIAVP